MAIPQVTANGITITHGQVLEQINTNFGLVVEKESGKSLMLDAERTKLAGLSNQFKGYFLTLSALSLAFPTGTAGDYAIIRKSGQADSQALWDTDDSEWVDTFEAPTGVDQAYVDDAILGVENQINTLNTNKQNTLTTDQLTNIAAVPSKANAADVYTKSQTDLIIGEYRIEIEASIFIDRLIAAGYTPPQNHILGFHEFVKQGKIDGWWAYLDFYAPLAGATAAAAVLEMKGATMSLVGSPTVSQNGIATNGTSSYINTTYNPSTRRTAEKMLMGFRRFATDVDTAGVSMGCQDTTNSRYCLLFPRLSTSSGFRLNSENVNTLGSRPYFGAYSVMANVKFDLWQNEEVIGQSTGDATGAILPNYEIYAGANNIAGVASNFTDESFASLWMGAVMPATLYKKFLQAEARLQTKMGRKQAQIIFDGNSFTADNIYPPRVLSNLGSYYYGQQFGVGGQTTQAMQADFASQIAPMSQRGKSKNILIFWEIRNDSVFGASVTDALAHARAYCQAAKDKDYKVIIAGLNPSYNVSAPNLETDRLAVNAQLRAEFTKATAYKNIYLPADATTWADLFIDLGADATMGQTGQNSNTTYYNVDLTHPNATGYNYLADTYFTPAVRLI